MLNKLKQLLELPQLLDKLGKQQAKIEQLQNDILLLKEQQQEQTYINYGLMKQLNLIEGDEQQHEQ